MITNNAFDDDIQLILLSNLIKNTNNDKTFCFTKKRKKSRRKERKIFDQLSFKQFFVRFTSKKNIYKYTQNGL